MRPRNLFILHGALLFMVFFFVSSCAVTQSNVGRTVIKSQRLAIDNETTPARVWQTNEISIQYTVSSTPDTISLSGTVHIKNAITASFPQPEFFNLYLNVLAIDGKVLETHNIRPNIGYRSAIAEEIPFSAMLNRPPMAVAIAYSYHGHFRGTTSDEYSGDWEIFFSPFAKDRK